MKLSKALFAAGCFWHVQFTFSQVRGVVRTTAGYCGGRVANPTYEQVCTGKTGHAEAVFVEFDSSVVSYSDLLDVFWEMHDPTQLNRQGPDVGSQYRSVIFYYSEEQREIAVTSLVKWQKKLGVSKKIVTEVVAAEGFYAAEEYHQDYVKGRKRILPLSTQEFYENSPCFKKTGRKVCGI
ncbi:peptide-methionine (S)-S-oxide reductase [Candidatus Nomurabacteria bacterium RIFCSPHIGHO2_01_FULL_39_10]|uniref:Peptide methionine sulfoxide reductase MsrA n=1 Tax=Candidatus Nomurabacteria bacterium RIFCSPHIGHO2_01_FULL_39_10 TaxID=1801733 RepID=A0A1F6V7J2_9BACT|nr:MAG: peptide-methionine (S)-S-oxide reductase [Candidatus Nomurabacteria bacterium RIFCSPHIGHO2_01_FULL_39_10]